MTLELQTVGVSYEYSAEKGAKTKVDDAGVCRAKARSLARANQCDGAQGGVNVPLRDSM